MESPQTRRQARHRGVLFVSGLVALLMVVLLVQLSAADDGPAPTPTPEPVPGEESPYADRVQSTEELKAQPPSLERYVAGHALTGDQLFGADLGESTKTVDREQVPPGGTVTYVIVLRNSGDTDAQITMTDTLPAELTYVDSIFNLPVGGLDLPGGSVDGNTVRWEGVLGTDGYVEIAVQAQLSLDAVAGTAVTNSAEVLSGDDTVTLEATFTVTEPSQSPIVQLPFIIYGFQPNPPDVTIQSTRPNSRNEWSITWQGEPTADGYQLQVSRSPQFTQVTNYDVGPNTTSYQFNPAPTPNNVYYYRARSLDSGIYGNWSNIVTVIGGYRDDFTDPNSGWKVRRTTFLEEVQTFYEIRGGDHWLILRVEDSWDWGIASPLRPAPALPYVIEYEVKHANLGNLVSNGAAFSGDWVPGSNCLEQPAATEDELYRHTDCFNHFYTTNTIFFGGLKMLFERVDRLEWCLNCGGSPMKRIGDIDPLGAVNLSGVDPEGWNRFRIEVRESGIKVFAGKRGGNLDLQYEYGDTRWVDSPYFGVFASTDEYSNSTARFEYYSVMPLD